MRGNNVLGLILANADDGVLSEITGIRSMASVPFGGGYRLIDFVLSNMVNAGMTKVGVLTDNNYQSLMDHLGSGKPWDLSRKNEGLFLLPPFNQEAVNNYTAGWIGALHNITNFLDRSREEYVLLTSCTYVANLDLTKVFAFHERNKADITLLTREGETPRLRDVPVVRADADGRVQRLTVSERTEAGERFGLSALLIDKSLLLRLVNAAFHRGGVSFEKDILVKNADRLNVYSYPVEGFCPVLDSMQSYFYANFELLKKENYSSLFRADRPVMTKVYEDMPAVYGIGCDVHNSLIADGCIVRGEVENCILFRNCRVEKDAVVKNSILLPGVFIGGGAMVNYCIMDKAVSLRAGKTLSGADTYPVFIGKNIQI